MVDVVCTWEELARRAEHYSHDRWLFRGVTRKKYLLIPSVGRNEWRHDGLTNNTRPFNPAEECQLLEAFKREARPRINYTPKDNNDIEWLAIGQHHGLVTRLLDWTQSLFVAAYFATEKADVQEVSRIYCIKEFDLFDIKAEPDVFKIGRPYTYRPPHISPRIPAQQAVFTVHDKPSEPLDSNSLQIIDIPGKYCIKLKRMLDVAGFNRASLFPDVDGLGVHLSWRYKWNWRL
jgi:FRG domain